jgi:hypothetical protein
MKKKKSTPKFLDDVIRLDQKLLNETIDKRFYERLNPVRETLERSRGYLTYANKLTFHRKHLERILSFSDEEILLHAAEMFLGPEHYRQWIDHYDTWAQASKDFLSRESQRLSIRYKCDEHWPYEFQKKHGTK